METLRLARRVVRRGKREGQLGERGNDVKSKEPSGFKTD